MLSKFEVVVMTPEVLVLALCHGSLQVGWQQQQQEQLATDLLVSS